MTYAYIVEPSAQGSGTNGWNYKWAEPGVTLRRQIQQALQDLGRYSGPVDGAWGPNTIKGIQSSIARAGVYSGPIDGAVGANTVVGAIRYAYEFASSKNGDPSVAKQISNASAPTWSALFTVQATWQYFRNRLQAAIS